MVQLKKIESGRVRLLGASIFARLHEAKLRLLAEGRQVIDLSIGSPDEPPVPSLRKVMAEALEDPAAFTYPSSRGSLAFRKAAANWLQARFGVTADPETELLTLIGTQDGLAHLPLALGDPGDVALVPDPGYPIHQLAPLLAGMEVYLVPMRPDGSFLPDLAAVPDAVRERAVMLLLSYPSNPTAAIAGRADMEVWVQFARENRLVLAHDLAYSEMAFDGFDPPSILTIPGAKEVAVEFHSLSKSFNLAGARLGFVAGHAGVLSALHTVKANIDYGVFEAVQRTGIAALEADIARLQRGGGEPAPASMIYTPRRDAFTEGVRAFGWHVPKPAATMFVWAPVPAGWQGDSESFASAVLEETGVVIVPGRAFGAGGEGYVRIAMVQPADRLRLAVERLNEFFRQHGLGMYAAGEVLR